ncbi:hypothetical protein GCM10010909_06870 [Acidocella aquatica]|uniref:Cytochrome P450 n=1 Tax=Acidocella aquatica TaxID=1922313 RepID=A0ABQ6A0N4_9PROT|nr:cytochrome P450 [Acidocella aquatica]GLR66009.1 hypothetical protein GCM10010909_06870 [Acidocella aquatica]
MPSAMSAQDVNLSLLAIKGDALLRELNQLRAYDPIYWSEESHCWIITGHAEVTEGFSGSLPISSHAFPEMLYNIMPAVEADVRLVNSVYYMQKISTNLDGAEHARVRGLLVKALNRKLVESLRPYVRNRISVLLDKAARLEELEFHESISRMLPGAVILRLLGLPEEFLPRLKGWSDGVTTALTSFNPEPAWLDQLEVVVADMLDVFRKEIESRRRFPKEDFITQLIGAVDGDARLSEDEMLATLIQVIIAGHDSTTNSLTLGIRALAQYPAAWRYWRSHPEKSLECSIELMRYIAMSAAMFRIVAEDFEWKGHRMKKGDVLMLMIAGGNRDPGLYKNPETLDFARENNDRALMFGPGLHHCIGHLLAKLQVSEFFNAVVQRFDGVEILEEPQFTPGLIFRSVQGLKLHFMPRQDAKGV